MRTQLGEAVASRIEGEALIAPELLDAEVLAVLRRGVRTGELGTDRARMAIADLVAWGLRRVPHAPLLRKAWEYRENVTAYDALYLAAANEFRAPVLTADGPLARAPATGVLVESVRV